LAKLLSRTAGWLVALLLLAGACAPAAGPARPAPTATAPGAGASAPTAAASAAPASAPAAPPTHVRIATQPLAADAAIAIAQARGYFQQEGLDTELIVFTNSSEMIPALATEQVDVTGFGSNAATWNAAARGVGFKLVLDKGSFRPGAGFAALAVRKDLYDAGRGHRLEDLRGLSLAMTPPGKATTNGAALGAALQRVGMSLDDLSVQPLTFPDMVPALANGSIDAAILSEPFLARVLQQGTAVKVMGQDEMYPNFTVGVVGYANALYANRPVAKAVTRAYIRAIRAYQAALAGQSGDADRAEIDEIIARHTGLDASIVHEMVPIGFSPNGLPNQESMLYVYQFFRDLGLIPEPLSDAAMANIWGFELVEEVLNEIGRQPE